MKTKIIKILPFLLLIVVIVLVAYGQTLGMYFWQDDSALIFKLQHQAEAAGSFGVGLWERSPYQYLVVPFVPFFSLFKLEPFWYFLVGFISYFGVVFCFWIFVKEFFQNKKFAYISTLIFSAGYIGSDIMFRVINSWQTNIGLCLSLLTIYYYLKYFNSKKVTNFFLSLFFYFLTIEAVYIRSHSLIFTIFAVDLLFVLRKISFKEIGKLIIRQLPFWFLFYKWYLNSESIGSNGLSRIIDNIFSGKIEVLTSLFATVGNTLVPDFFVTELISRFRENAHLVTFFILSITGLVFLRIFSKGVKMLVSFFITFFAVYLLNKYFYALELHWYRSLNVVIPGLIGMFGLVFSFFTFLSLWSKHKIFAIGIALGYLIIVSQIFGYYIQYPESVFGTTHRYLSNPFVGYSLFYGSIFSIWYTIFHKMKIFSVVPMILLIGANLYLGSIYQKDIVLNRSIPSRNFYNSLLNYVPEVEKGSTFYFDVARNSYYERQFGDFFSVGSMPETTALAIYYNVDRYDVSMFTNFDELVTSIAEGKTDINKVYTFYYGPNGLIDTTKTTRKLLLNGSPSLSLKINGTILLTEGINSLVPQQLNLSMQISEADLPVFPYSFAKDQSSELSFEQKIEILKYLSRKSEYYKNVKVTSLSDWRYSEINYAIDNNTDTAWQSHRTRWDKIKDDNVTVDMSQVKNIDKLFWTNNRNTLTPRDYEIFTSLDGINWVSVKKVENGPERKNAEVVKEHFEKIEARFVKMQITRTLTDDSPSISEFEVIESDVNVDPAIANIYINNPFGDVKSPAEWNLLYQNFISLAKMKVVYSTDKNNSDIVLEIPVKLDGNIHTYKTVIPQSGTRLNNIKVMLNFPASIKILNANLTNLSVSDLKSKNLIKFFSTN